MDNKIKSWHGWFLFFASMVIVLILGLIISTLMERRAENLSLYSNRKVEIKGIESRNEVFNTDFPNQYDSWRQTADTSFQSEFNGNRSKDVLEMRPRMVILWAGYAFSKEYTSPRGHFYAVQDVRHTLRTGAPLDSSYKMQPGTCWTCKSPDVPRVMEEVGISNFYKAKWSTWGDQIVNPIGCADCHEPIKMSLHISRPALREAFERRGEDVDKVSQQQMRSLVCAQCHVEYYFQGSEKYLTFPWDKGFTVEEIEKYYDEKEFTDYVNPLSKAPILKAQHPDFELFQMGIHAQRGISCADCHMPYTTEGAIKYSDHHLQSPLAAIDRVCLNCHRQPEEVLRNNVYERQRKCIEVRDRLEEELCKAHIEAKFAWDKGANEEEMKPVLKLIRESQWRWDFGVASHGASFHAPLEIQRILSSGLDRALQARLVITKILASHGFIGDIPMPDISTKSKAQQYIGLDISNEKERKQLFLNDVVPEWIKSAKEKGRLIES